jgi:hypothetical protein
VSGAIQPVVSPRVSVRAGRDAYFAANGFDVVAYGAATYEVDLVEVTGEVWTFPNTPARRRAVARHDLHHVATGYGTDVLGEAEIGAWELVAGCNSLFLWWINLSAVGVGLLLGPGRTLRAALRAAGQRTLYRDPLAYESLLEMSVPELRARLRMPPGGQADRPPRLHRRAPGNASDPQFSLPGPLRRVLRLVSGVVNPAFGGVRVPNDRS